MTISLYAEGELVPGTVYRVVQKLGTAGHGSVYEVEDTSVGKRYCLKTLDAVTSDIGEFRRRVQIEAQTLARLAHPNIVQVFTAGVTEDERHLPYFVMELLKGRSLRESLEAKGPIDVAHTLDVGTQILDALDHAHDRGVIHRDVKPENIFLQRLTPEAPVTAKLLDFGVVSFLRDFPGVGPPPGLSPRYAAPELLEGGTATVASDLYSMGLVLYEMLCGHGPFDDAGDLADVARARLTRGPRPLTVDVPLVLEDLIICALERNPALRPSDAFSFAETLRVLSGRISRIPQRSLLSSEPPAPVPELTSISGIPAALVAADWRPPPTPRAGEVESEDDEVGPSTARSSQLKDRSAYDLVLDVEPGEAILVTADVPMSSKMPPLPGPSGAGPSVGAQLAGTQRRDTLVGIGVGLAVLLVALVIVMLK